MRTLPALALLSAVGCGSGNDLPVQDADTVVAIFGAAARACSAGLTPEGGIDQRAVAASGWSPMSRSLDRETERRALAPSDYPRLQRGEIETSEWRRENVPNPLYLTRFDGAPEGLRDSCSVDAQTEGRGGADRVAAAMARRFGRAPDRMGPLPRGGDFLTPRSDRPRYGRYWAMRQNDVYLTTAEDGYARLEIIAMADRDALDAYHPDRVESRIPTVEAPGQ